MPPTLTHICTYIEPVILRLVVYTALSIQTRIQMQRVTLLSLSGSRSLWLPSHPLARERNSFTFSRSFLTSVVIVVAIIVVFGNFDRHVEPCGICVGKCARFIHMLSYLNIAHIKIGLIGSETPNMYSTVLK